MAGVGRYLRSLKWTPLPLGVGFVVIAAQQYRHTRRREEGRIHSTDSSVCLAKPWEVQAYKLLPLRHFSRVWGWVNDVYLPEWCRGAVLGSYVRTFGCDMTEAEQEDLHKYKCLSSLFRRALKCSTRPVCQIALLTSPVDGTVLQAGPVKCSTLHQIKGVCYSMQQFLGPNVWNTSTTTTRSDGGPLMGAVKEDSNNDSCYHRSCLTDPVSNELYQVVLYLAPGDYHRFHSAADWRVSLRRHFPGELLSVNPSFAAWIQDLFVLNERVSYLGSWQHGFFSMTAVGATNVGSVKVYGDPQLTTNRATWKRDVHEDKSFVGDDGGMRFGKGEAFGEFNLGSTIVLLFEAPKGSVLSVESGQKIKMGEAVVMPLGANSSYAEKAEGGADELKSKGVSR